MDMNLSSINSRLSALELNQAWQLLRPQPISDPAASIRFDEKLLPRVGSGELGPCVCIKTAPRCLVVTRREARMANFAQASAELAALGWPVVVRCSGGASVPQGPGVISLSVIHPRPPQWALEDGYLLLCELLKQLLASYGLDAEYGEVAGAFCDGRYNLQFAGRKLVGTAQRWAGGNRKQAAVLAHACLLVDLNLQEATRMLNQFYQRCNLPQQFNPLACTTLREARQLPAQADSGALVTSVEQRLAAQISAAFGITEPTSHNF